MSNNTWVENVNLAHEIQGKGCWERLMLDVSGEMKEPHVTESIRKDNREGPERQSDQKQIQLGMG